jgi:hypothetical protein
MTPTLILDLQAAETELRTIAATLDVTDDTERTRMDQLARVAFRINCIRTQIEDMTLAPVPPPARAPRPAGVLIRLPPRLRVIEGGAA